MSSGESEFYSATVCACELLWACEFFKGIGVHRDCMFERGRICMHRHGNTLGTWTTKTRRDQALCIATLGTTGTTEFGQGDYDRAVSRHHDKTLFKADFGDIGSENWFGESNHRFYNISNFTGLDPNSNDCSRSLRKCQRTQKIGASDNVTQAERAISGDYISSAVIDVIEVTG